MKTVPFQTTWGTITLTLDDSGKVVALNLPSLKKTPHEPFSIERFQTLENLAREFPTIGIPAGTNFQKSVWRELKKIPRGQTRTYGEIAAAIGNPRAVRAVGSACGANPLPVFIPCHRVVSKTGLGGFGSGLPWKLLLLKTEGAL
jgi:O-6-methylguanine DNA methyltransferase